MGWPKFSLVLCCKPTKVQFSKQKYYSNPKTYQAEHFRPKSCWVYKENLGEKALKMKYKSANNLMLRKDIKNGIAD